MVNAGLRMLQNRTRRRPDPKNKSVQRRKGGGSVGGISRSPYNSGYYSSSPYTSELGPISKKKERDSSWSALDIIMMFPPAFLIVVGGFPVIMILMIAHRIRFGRWPFFHDF